MVTHGALCLVLLYLVPYALVDSLVICVCFGLFSTIFICCSPRIGGMQTRETWALSRIPRLASTGWTVLSSPSGAWSLCPPPPVAPELLRNRLTAQRASIRLAVHITLCVLRSFCKDVKALACSRKADPAQPSRWYGYAVFGASFLTFPTMSLRKGRKPEYWKSVGYAKSMIDERILQ